MNDEVSLVPSSSAALMGSGESAVELPSKLVITRAPGVFELSWKWRDQVSRGAFFAPFVSGMAGLGGMMNAMVHTPLLAIPIVGTFGVVALATSFGWARGVMRVRVAQGALTTSGAMMSRKSEIPAADIALIEVIPRNRRVQKAGAAVWSVVAVLTTSKRRVIVGHVLRLEQAEAIAQIIREALAGE